jgi:hypothetical protein
MLRGCNQQQRGLLTISRYRPGTQPLLLILRLKFVRMAQKKYWVDRAYTLLEVCIEISLSLLPTTLYALPLRYMLEEGEYKI